LHDGDCYLNGFIFYPSGMATALCGLDYESMGETVVVEQPMQWLLTTIVKARLLIDFVAVAIKSARPAPSLTQNIACHCTLKAFPTVFCVRPVCLP
jgi:hypothetical protein